LSLYKQEVLNATARLSGNAAFSEGLGSQYLVWRSPLYANGIGAGALTLIVSSAQILRSQKIVTVHSTCAR